MHGRRISFGKFKGELWTRVPASYLKHLANEMKDPVRSLALLELQRRGVSPDSFAMEVSAHAIDRASIRLTKTWRQYRNSDEEGLHSWLLREAHYAFSLCGIDSYDEQSDGKNTRDIVSLHHGMKMVFTIGKYYPVLKTVSPLQ